jgi:hypothetical protein
VRHNISAFGLYQIPFHSTHAVLRHILGGWSVSETAFIHSGLPFTVLSQAYTANNNGIFQASGPQFARRAPRVQLYRKTPYSGVTVAGTKQWLNPEAFVSVVDPTTGACTGGDSVTNCQFGDLGRNTVRAYPNVAAVQLKWAEVEEEQTEFVNRVTTESLETMLPFRKTQVRLAHLMQHLANHSTYHRGQIALMMRQLNAEPLATDFHLFLVEGRRQTAAAPGKSGQFARMMP